MSLGSIFRTGELVTALKAAAEPTRMRILVLLAGGEFNVKDLQLILGQSQPRISRHLKLLAEAKLIERFREGSWAYFQLADRTPGGRWALQLIASVDLNDPILRRDRDRAETLKRERESTAQRYFAAHAADWDNIRALHVAESDVEAAMGQALGPGPFNQFVDLGTGTGRILELFSGRYERAVGIDANQSMLAYARANLTKAGLAGVQVRHGDIYALTLPDRFADAVVMHQVLHFLSDPQVAIREAARILTPGGRMVVVDFAPHELEFLRDTQAHERLGFAAGQVEQWLTDAGLAPLGVQLLAPDQADAGKLTVTLWLAEKPQAPTRSGRTEETMRLEEAG